MCAMKLTQLLLVLCAVKVEGALGFVTLYPWNSYVRYSWLLDHISRVSDLIDRRTTSKLALSKLREVSLESWVKQCGISL
jgi:hypothetical protein